MLCVPCPHTINMFTPIFLGKHHLFPVFYLIVKKFYFSDFLYTTRTSTCFMLDRGCHLFLIDANLEELTYYLLL
ncbi:hypothetical protein GHT06_015385 [Daphnia sinensis]|uniref:Uncharacterized protein n=1 Tax=Daphnia sinensis TaxID=1820382 RepID=A0AAD5KR58_9CRUS|nr:hypothetical protein GHT06_015385 [Daphnia sinensis]